MESGVIVIVAAVALLAGFLLGWIMKSGKSIQVATDPLYLKALEDIKQLQSAANAAQESAKMMHGENQRMMQRNSDLEERIAAREKDLTDVKEQMLKDFQILADRLFNEKSESLKKNSQGELKLLLEPFDNNLRDFRKTVQESYDKSRAESISLKEQLIQLKQLNERMTTEANNLTSALKGDNKTQGNWGEVVLERVLENSGLTEGREYELQSATVNAEGKRIIPDVLVKLPDNKHLVIDSKVSLLAYEQYVSSDKDEDKTKLLKAHLDSLKSHVKGLSEKHYTSGKGINSPDFVLLFIPIESSFGLAIQGDQHLYEFAWQHNIVIVSPSTLLATMRTVSNIWKHEHQNRNTQAIADEAGALIDKFQGLLDDMSKLGKQLETAQGTYNDAFKKLSEGKGNLIGRMDKLNKLGANSRKQIGNRDDKLWRKAVKESDPDNLSDEEEENG
jgi:DNA recombination protein RmuC